MQMAVTPKSAGVMKLKKPSIGTRAWRVLRLAVLWARRRRGGAAHSLRLRLLRTIRSHSVSFSRARARGDRLRYGEREFSIDETPAFRLRAPSSRVLRLIVPCIAPDTPGLYYGDDRYFFSSALHGTDRDEVDDDAGSPYYGYGGGEGQSCCCGGDEDDGDDEGGESCSADDDEEQLLEHAMAEARRASSAAADGDAGVDVKAEEFIARFYAQMKLQRQISWLQYNEMMQRSVS